MGYEHGAVQPEEHFEAVVIATQLEGQLRDGHLSRDDARRAQSRIATCPRPRWKPFRKPAAVA